MRPRRSSSGSSFARTGIDSIHLQVRFSNDLAVFLVILVEDSGEICTTLPTREEAKHRKLRLDLRRLQCGSEPANLHGYLRCWRLREASKFRVRLYRSARQQAETRRNSVMPITSQGVPFIYGEPNKKLAFERRRTMLRRNWLEYDVVALPVLVIGLGAVLAPLFF